MMPSFLTLPTGAVAPMVAKAARLALLPRISQPVEKVVVGAVGGPTTGPRHLKTSPKHYKTGVSSPRTGSENGTKGFFNTLPSSRHSGE